MRWKKSTDKPTASGKYFIKDTGYGMGMFEFRADTGNWYWHPPTDPVGEAYQFEWLDESLPASIEQEAEALYPYLQPSDYLSMDVENINRIADYKRRAHITAARQYMDTIEKLRALLKETVGPCECEECQKSWNEYKAKHNL